MKNKEKKEARYSFSSAKVMTKHGKMYEVRDAQNRLVAYSSIVRDLESCLLMPATPDRSTFLLGGTLRDCVFSNTIIRGGIFSGGTFADCTIENGTFCGGVFTNCTIESGTYLYGEFLDGVFKCGTPLPPADNIFECGLVPYPTFLFDGQLRVTIYDRQFTPAEWYEKELQRIVDELYLDDISAYADEIKRIEMFYK